MKKLKVLIGMFIIILIGLFVDFMLSDLVIVKSIESGVETYTPYRVGPITNMYYVI